MVDQPCIAVSVKLEYWEAYRANVVLMARHFHKFLAICGVVGVFTLLLAICMALSPRPGKDWYDLGMNSRPLLWFFAFPALLVFFVPLYAARNIVESETLKKGVIYKFSERGIHYESSVANAEMQWTAFRHAIETQSAFLIYQTSNLANIIPLRCFAHGADLNAMRKLLRDKLPKSKLRGD
jgi:hypothetical protein